MASTNGTHPADVETAHLHRVRQAETELEVAVGDEAALKSTARQYFGSVGRRERLAFTLVLEASGARWSQAAPLWALAFADALCMAGLVTVAPAAQLGSGSLGPFISLRIALFGMGGVLGLGLLDRGLSRATLARGAALSASIGMLSASLATGSLAGFLSGLVVATASGVTATVVVPMLFDAYRPELRVRLVGGFVAAVMLGLGGARIVSEIAYGAGLTWRAAVLAMAVAPLATGAALRRVGEPEPGRWDHRRAARLVQHHLGGAGDRDAELTQQDVAVATMVRFRRVLAFRSTGAVVLPTIVFGMFAWGLPDGLGILLRDRWALVSQSQGLAYGTICLATIPGVLWFAGRAETAFRHTPKDVLRLTSSAALTAGAALATAAVAPVFWLSVLFLWISFTAVAGVLVVAVFLLLTVTQPALRSHAAVLLGLLTLVGASLGPQLIGTIGTRFGVEWGLILLALVATGAASNLGRAVSTIEGDIDAMVGTVVESQELATRVSLGHHLPLLSCRNVNFAYGQVQVLFDVSFTVDDGEMVALLGTNGAGKSTLLRLISGLDFPSSGSIHYRGADVTFLGSERRVELGISQIPGGKAIFGLLTVMDNLRAYGYTLGRNKAQLDRGIDEAMVALPRLAERRNQLAATLSGGERQMLALAKAYLLKPRLLAIDELSLGLAPIIVGELLDTVRQINTAGTAIVLVEQSVNVALSVVDHAYFMEKGEMRFDGIARELIERPDILRSVFLEGASKGLKSVAATR